MSKKPVIVFEGIEASGKSHHILCVSRYLKKKKVSFIVLFFVGKVARKANLSLTWMVVY